MPNQLREDTAYYPPISEVNKEALVQPDVVFQTSPVYRRISAAEAKQMMQNTDKYILLDVRTKEEFEEQHIEGAVLIPDYEIGSRAATELPDKNALILIYCRIGRRSANVAHELIKMGYTNVYDFGGIMDWQYDTVRR
jgi:rhodanese-related sulfurtransferase